MDNRSLLDINYPTLTQPDLDWIQGIRKRHDELYFEVVAPHFTLVFPTFNQEEAAFSEHVRQIAHKTQPFDFVLRCAVLGDDAFSDYTHVLLVPDEGYSQIVRLHDRLYTGILSEELRLDIPFVPHIGIANSKDPKTCKHLVDEINARAFEISGRVEHLDVIEYADNRVRTLEHIPLGSGGKL
jgi:2'-5' RNA ligase